ncbi:MAG: hypothetical protein PVI86_15160 [Phycisphaerae bacterium]|jgi:hypothetical protein
MVELKSISKQGVDAALAKANQYRLLNEPREAESICRDVLAVEPGNQTALVMLLLSVTDQFEKGYGTPLDAAQTLIEKLEGEYARAYYAGVIAERWGKSRPGIGAPASVVHSWLREAMDHYQHAESIRPAGNDEAILRWNTCARILNREVPREKTTGHEPSVWDNPE